MRFYLDKLNEAMLQNNYDSEYREACINYAERLISNNLPVIFDADHLCLLLGINNRKLATLVHLGEKYSYHTIEIPKKNGGRRTLTVPANNLKAIQKWILVNILESMKTSESTHGFKKKESIVSNAKDHIRKEYIINIDMKDFFPTIDSERIFKIFYYYGYTKEVSNILTRLCTCNGVLPQGAPTSPYLSNVVTLKLDKRFEMLCNKLKANYSRYADDITVSGDNRIVKYIEVYKKIIIDEGFKVNEEKFRVRRPFQRQMVTGLIVNEKMTVPRKYKNYLRQQIYFCKKYGVDGHLQHTNCLKSNYREHLYGIAYFIKMVEQEKGIEYLQQLDEIAWN